MALNMNQFKLGNVLGKTMNPAANVIQAQLYLASGTANAGDVVCFGSTSSEMPVVRKVNTGCGIGVIVFNARTNAYTSGMIIGVALAGTIVTVQATSAITRGDVVGWGSTGVGTLGAAKYGLGIAIDNATYGTEIIRVLLQPGVYSTSPQIWY
jgi:hypothetical protein